MQNTVTISSSEPELKNGSVLNAEVIITAPVSGSVMINDRIRKHIETYRQQMAQFNMPSEPECLTAYGKIVMEMDVVTDSRFTETREESETRYAELRSQMCKYHCHGGNIGEVSPAGETFKTFTDKRGKPCTVKQSWKEGCAGHDHGDKRYVCDKIHIGPIYKEDNLETTTQNSSQPETETSASVYEQEDTDSVSSTLTESSANGNAPGDMSSGPFVGAGAGNWSQPTYRRENTDLVIETVTECSAEEAPVDMSIRPFVGAGAGECSQPTSRRENTGSVIKTVTECSAKGNAPGDMSRPNYGGGAGNWSDTVEGRKTFREGNRKILQPLDCRIGKAAVSTTLTVGSANGNAPMEMSKTASNNGTGVVSEKQGQHVSKKLDSVSKEEQNTLDAVSNTVDMEEQNKLINDLMEGSAFDEYYEGKEKDIKKLQKQYGVIVARSTLWLTLWEGELGKTKPLDGRLRKLAGEAKVILNNVKNLCRLKVIEFNKYSDEIAAYWGRYSDIHKEIEAIVQDYNVHINKYNIYYKNWEDSIKEERYYADLIEELVPGAIDGDPERGINPHISEDRKFWFKMEKIGVLSETISTILGRPVTSEELKDLRHSQKILKEHLIKFELLTSSEKKEYFK